MIRINIFHYVVAFILPCLIVGLATERKPWNAVRFIQQSSKFISLPFIPKKNNEIQNIEKGTVLWKADDIRNNIFTMAPLDDVVMGGASSSTFDSNTGIWSGIVTDANNGGFIGIRSTPSFIFNMNNNNNCNGIEWKLNSYEKTIKRFKFVIRDSIEFNGITWTTSIDIKPGMNTVRINFNKQIPALFAKTVDGQTFQKNNVVGFQIAYSKFEYDNKMNPKFQLGNIKLQLLELRAI